MKRDSAGGELDGG